MLIREYRNSDFERICTIGKHLDPTPPPLYFRSTIGEGKAWVAEQDGVVIGFLVSSLKRWKPPTTRQNTLLPYINSIAVDSAHQKQGIGTALINHFEEYYKKFRCFGLYVRTDNPARMLYAHLGYRIYKVLDHFYGKNKNGYFMTKLLPSEQ